MQALKDMEIGVMFWAGRDPAETIREVARLYAEAADPPVDERGSAEYKRRVTEVFVRRAVMTAALLYATLTVWPRGSRFGSE